MEDAPLILAHNHARKAADETAKSHFPAAGTEHDSAAVYFAKAGDDTGDIEALRILALLEEHHLKLAQIVKIKNEFAKRSSPAEKQRSAEVQEKDSGSGNEEPISTKQSRDPRSPEKAVTPSLLKTRTTPSSLAKDMASRRGIPQSQQHRTPVTAADLSPVQASGRISAASNRGAPLDGRHGDSAATEALSGQNLGSNTIASATPQPDDGFARFYSNLTSGPLSKLSSMLAYAGLPLAEQAQDDSPTSSKTEKISARVSTGPDVNKLFSKAALKALEEQKRHPGNAFGPAESFYVIPTSGGTASYANILGKDRQSALRGDDSDEFVDAKEVMTDSDRRGAKQAGGEPSAVLRVEELQIENAAMKQILDKLSHRLQAFESHAQDASMAALTQSMASVRAGPAQSSHERDERMRAMEAQLEREMRERERLSQENQRQKQVISKYRSHWEQLKDSARARAKKEKDVPASPAK